MTNFKEQSGHIQNRFNSHDCITEELMKMDDVREACLELAALIEIEVPKGREQSLALTKLEEVMFWANAGIARNYPKNWVSGPGEEDEISLDVLIGDCPVHDPITVEPVNLSEPLTILVEDKLTGEPVSVEINSVDGGYEL